MRGSLETQEGKTETGMIFVCALVNGLPQLLSNIKTDHREKATIRHET